MLYTFSRTLTLRGQHNSELLFKRLHQQFATESRPVQQCCLCRTCRTRSCSNPLHHCRSSTSNLSISCLIIAVTASSTAPIAPVRPPAAAAPSQRATGSNTSTSAGRRINQQPTERTAGASSLRIRYRPVRRFAVGKSAPNSGGAGAGKALTNGRRRPICREWRRPHRRLNQRFAEQPPTETATLIHCPRKPHRSAKNGGH